MEFHFWATWKDTKVRWCVLRVMCNPQAAGHSEVTRWPLSQPSWCYLHVGVLPTQPSRQSSPSSLGLSLPFIYPRLLVSDTLFENAMVGMGEDGETPRPATRGVARGPWSQQRQGGISQVAPQDAQSWLSSFRVLDWVPTGRTGSPQSLTTFVTSTILSCSLILYLFIPRHAMVGVEVRDHLCEAFHTLDTAPALDTS